VAPVNTTMNSNTTPDPAQCAGLVVGAGYLGARLAARHAREAGPVWCTTRGSERAERRRAAGLQVLQLGWPAPPPPAGGHGPLPARVQCLYFLVPPGALGREPGIDACLDSLVPLLERLQPARVVLASSTVVYGDAGGAWVAADSPALGTGVRAERQLAIEAWWRARAPVVHCVRLAGLYGPGRVIGARALAAGEPIAGSPEAWLNLVQVDDAARLLLRVATMPEPPPVLLGADGAPVRRGDYYRFVGEQLGVPVRLAGEAGARDSRRCANTAAIAATGWRPRYPDYRTGVPAALAEQGRAGGG